MCLACHVSSWMLQCPSPLPRPHRHWISATGASFFSRSVRNELRKAREDISADAKSNRKQDGPPLPSPLLPREGGEGERPLLPSLIQGQCSPQPSPCFAPTGVKPYHWRGKTPYLSGLPLIILSTRSMEGLCPRNPDEREESNWISIRLCVDCAGRAFPVGGDQHARDGK